jgi:hypothetical protein
MASADFSFRFITVTLSGTNKISPGKNAILIRTTAKSTPPILDHKSFASMCMLALIGIASYLVFVHRLTDSFRTSSPRSVTLTRLYFPLLAVVSSQEDFHPQDRAHAGRTHSPRLKGEDSQLPTLSRAETLCNQPRSYFLLHRAARQYRLSMPYASSIQFWAG